MRRLKHVFKFPTFGFLLVLVSYVNSSYADDWVYSVREGDTLWGLCIEYTTEENCWQKVGAYNGVEYPRSLAPGTRIKFPVSWLKHQPVTVELVHIKGAVLVLNPETDSEAVARKGVLGEHLNIGGVIETGESSSATLKFADGAVLVMEPESKIVLDSLSKNGTSGMVDSKVRLLHGTGSAKVPVLEPRSGFRVSSPSAVAAVRGTDFRVSTYDTDTSFMVGSVYEGTIVVSSHDEEDFTPVETGFGIRAVQGMPIGKPKKLLVEPEFLTDTDLQDYPLKIKWREISGAESYIVEVLVDTPEDKLVELIKSKESAITIPMNESACYRIRVSAIDIDQLKGMPGEIKLCGQTKPELPVKEKSEWVSAAFVFLLVLLAVL